MDQTHLDTLLTRAHTDVTQCDTSTALIQIKAQYLGKKGEITDLMKLLKTVPADQKPAMGQAINQLKQAVLTLCEQRKDQLELTDLNTQLTQEAVDVTLPGRHAKMGGAHPITRVKQRVESIFANMGFSVETGPEIETEFYNFEALNIPEHHPARDMADTFYCHDGHLLRTHTSSVQMRVMQNSTPPLRLIAPGRVYRCDSDVTHTPMFHQVEGMYIDKDVSMAELKGLLKIFLQTFFEQEDIKLRFRPSFFPFTEPSAEVDISCVHCHGQGCRICAHTGWIEILGCGLVHPNVLKAGGIDTTTYTGLAFGIGLERLAMLHYKIPDLRILFENDVRFLDQFSGL